MTVFIVHADADQAVAEELAAFLKLRGMMVEPETGARGFRHLQSSDVVVALWSQQTVFSVHRLQMEKRMLDAWAEQQLVLVKLDHGIPPVGMRDLPSVDATFAQSRQLVAWAEVERRARAAIQSALQPPVPPAPSALSDHILPAPSVGERMAPGSFGGGGALGEPFGSQAPMPRAAPPKRGNALGLWLIGLAVIGIAALGVAVMTQTNSSAPTPVASVSLAPSPAAVSTPQEIASAQSEAQGLRDRLGGARQQFETTVQTDRARVAELQPQIDRAADELATIQKQPADAAAEKRATELTLARQKTQVQVDEISARIAKAQAAFDVEHEPETTRLQALDDQVARWMADDRARVAAEVDRVSQVNEDNAKRVAAAQQRAAADAQTRQAWLIGGVAAAVGVGLVALLLLVGRGRAQRAATPAAKAAPAAPPPPLAEPAPSPALFISYSHADDAAVTPLVAMVEEHGRTVWIDKTGIHSGDGWAGEIVKAIKSAHGVLVMCSKHSFESDHVKREVYLADKYKKPMAPMFLEQAAPPEDFEYFFANVQWLELWKLPEADRAAAIGQALKAV